MFTLFAGCPHAMPRVHDDANALLHLVLDTEGASTSFPNGRRPFRAGLVCVMSPKVCSQALVRPVHA